MSEINPTSANPKNHRSNTQQLLAAVASYLDLGLRVLPGRPGVKHPFVKWTPYRDRMPTLDEWVRWLASCRNCNIACLTGRPSGIFTVDSDNEQAEAFVNSLNLPGTVTAKTRRGYHRHYRYPKSVTIPGSDISKNVNVKSDGGIIMLPPGRFWDDSGSYEWVISPSEMTFATLSNAQARSLLELMEVERLRRAGESKKKKAKSRSSPLKAGAQKIRQSTSFQLKQVSSVAEASDRFKKLKTMLRDAEPTTRNQTLYRVTAEAARLANRRLLNPDIVEHELALIAEEIGLGIRDVADTIRSGFTSKIARGERILSR